MGRRKHERAEDRFRQIPPVAIDPIKQFTLLTFLRKLLFEACIIRTDDAEERVTPVIVSDDILICVVAEGGHVKAYPICEINSIEKIT